MDWKELRRALKGLGFPVSKKEVRGLVRKFVKGDETGMVRLSLRPPAKGVGGG